MSISRGEISGFLRGQVAAGKTEEEAKKAFQEWLTAQNEAIATKEDKAKILDDLDSYKV